jgi:hypothetical protein
LLLSLIAASWMVSRAQAREDSPPAADGADGARPYQSTIQNGRPLILRKRTTTDGVLPLDEPVGIKVKGVQRRSYVEGIAVRYGLAELQVHLGKLRFKCKPCLRLFLFRWALVERSVGKKIQIFFQLSLITVLILMQTPPAHPIEVSTPGVSTVNNCDISKSDFKAEFKRLSESIKRNQDIPQEFLERHFAGCTIENARKLLVKNGFAAEELGPEFDENEPEKVIPRRMMAAKGIRRIGPLGSFNCRIILQTDTSKRVKAEGFFYFDGP